MLQFVLDQIPSLGTLHICGEYIYWLCDSVIIYSPLPSLRQSQRRAEHDLTSVLDRTCMT
jgi:hypothetical protein